MSAPLGFGFLLTVLVAQTPLGHAGRLRGPVYSASFEEVDFAEIEERARQRSLDVEEARLGDLVRRNFSYLFWNCLDQKRFLAPPPPKRVAESMVQVLDLSQRLTLLLAEARKIASTPGWTRGGALESKSGRLILEMGEAAKELKNAFQGSFVEVHRARYKLSIPGGREPRGRFLAFLLQAERINRSLIAKVDDYFFNSDPGAIKVTDFEEASVGVLAEALFKLCEASGKAGRH